MTGDYTNRSTAFAILLTAAAVACGAPSKPATTTPREQTAPREAARHAGDDVGERVYEFDPMIIEARGIDDRGVAAGAQTLLEQGNDALARGLPEAAIAAYEELVSAFPESRLIANAVYNLGMAHEARGAYDEALAHYEQLVADGDGHAYSIRARMRMGAIFAELGRWTQASQVLDGLLARTDLTHADRIEGMARRGYVAIEQKDYPAAETILRNALTYYGTLTTPLDSNYFAAMCYYYLAHIPHRQFRAMPMRLPDEQLRRDLDAKSELVALAYDRYLEVLQVLDPYWATAAGYQMSEIYKQLWDDIVRAPIPTQLSPEAVTYYVREVHERVRGLLDKAMKGHLKNVELAEAYETATVWSDASREQAVEIARILARETSGEIVIPESASPPTVSGVTAGARGDYIPARIDL